jgi:hypothetical protein
MRIHADADADPQHCLEGIKRCAARCPRVGLKTRMENCTGGQERVYNYCKLISGQKWVSRIYFIRKKNYRQDVLSFAVFCLLAVFCAAGTKSYVLLRGT